MKTIKLISFLQIIAILALIFAGCGKSETPQPPVDENPDFTLTESGEKLPFYSDGVFNFNIITPVEDNESYELAKATVFKKARALNKKRPEFMRDNVEAKEGTKSIFIGVTNHSLSKEAKDILDKNKNNHFNYVIYAKDGNIAIVGANETVLEEALDYFTTKVFKDMKSTISTNYMYHYAPVFDTNLKINNTDASYFKIQCDDYPSGIVYMGCEELQTAIHGITGSKIPIERDKDYVADSLIKVVKTEGETDAYGVKFEDGTLVVYGGSDSALNAALHHLAKNISSIKEKTNIPSDYLFQGKFTDETGTTDGYKLVWSDEFNEDEININFWKLSRYQRLNNLRTPDAISVADGCAVITSKPTTLPDGSSGYETGELEGKNVNFAYGYFEIRAKLPVGPGNWASFWASGKMDAKHQCYPEIDVYETTGYASAVTSALHTWWTNGKTVKGLYAPGQEKSGHITHLNDKSVFTYHSGNYSTYNNKDDEYFGNEFHTFGCEWTPSYIRFLCDGVMYCEIDLKSVLVDPNYGYRVTPFLSLTDGGTVNFRIGNLLNSPDAYKQSDETSEIPSKYYIDYVRLYQMDSIGVLNIVE